MAFGPPRVPPPADDEREVLLGFLGWKRSHVVATTEGLTEEQLRWTPGDRLLPLIGLVNHVAHMEWRWIQGRYLGEPFPPREANEYVVSEDRDLASVVDAYAEQAARTDRIVREAPSLEVPCLGEEGDRGPAHAIFGFDAPLSLRWVLVHVLEDTIHHAGHADSTRELLDGRRMT